MKPMPFVISLVEEKSKQIHIATDNSSISVAIYSLNALDHIDDLATGMDQ
jgi:hypothetical protein